MIGITKMAVIAAGLLLVGVAAASPGTSTPASEHAAAKAREVALSHSTLHGKTIELSADRRCDEFRNHGAYVSSVAANASHDQDDEAEDNESDERGNKTHGHNGTSPRDEGRQGPKNETREDDETRQRDGENLVREAAHSDIGKCGGHANGDEAKPAHGNETRPEHPADDADDEGEESRGRSDEARAEHPPRNEKDE